MDSILIFLSDIYNSLPKSETLVSLYFMAFIIALVGNKIIPRITGTSNETLYEWYMMMFYMGTPFLLFGLFMNFKTAYVYALITWWFFAWIICLVGGEKDYFPLSYALVIFYSEYYELPIYFHRYLNGFNIPWILLFTKLCMVVVVIILITKLGFNGLDFLKHLIWFTIPYVVFGWLVVDIFCINNLAAHISPLILKFICFADLMFYMFIHGYFIVEDIEQ